MKVRLNADKTVLMMIALAIIFFSIGYFSARAKGVRARGIADSSIDTRKPGPGEKMRYTIKNNKGTISNLKTTSKVV